MRNKEVRIAIDFDGTIAKHKYPSIGEPVPGAIEWIKKFKEAGALIILWTMRSDGSEDGNVLSEAVLWCYSHGIIFDGINEGIGDRQWTLSPKPYAQCYIDDNGFGCPLQTMENWKELDRPYVDWNVVGPQVLKMIETKMRKK